MFETTLDIYYLLSRPYILLLLAFMLDLCIGDPRWLPHPIRIMGWVISKAEGLLIRIVKAVGNKQSAINKKLAGIILVLTITGSTYGLSYASNSMLLSFHFSFLTSFILLLVMVYLISTTIATKGLIDSARSVIEDLKGRKIEDARKSLKHIVGRDTDLLDEKGVTRAMIESLSENASDGIIAPIFYFAIGGLPLAMTYKAINTMDSMVGYKNDKYRYFGWAAARLDDIANYIPARLTGLLIVISSFIVFRSLFTVHCSLKTMLRDGRNHPSPNSGIPEAAIAGALGIGLGGTSTYGGILVEKPYIGEYIRSEVNNEQLAERSISIVKLTSVLGLGFSLIVLYLRSAV